MSCLLAEHENTLYLMKFRIKTETNLVAMFYIKTKILMALIHSVLSAYSLLLQSSLGFAFLFHIKTFNINISQ